MEQQFISLQTGTQKINFSLLQGVLHGLRDIKMKNITNKLMTEGKMSLLLLVSLFALWGCASIPKQGNINYPSGTKNSAEDYKKNPSAKNAVEYKIPNPDGSVKFIIDTRKIPGYPFRKKIEYSKQFLDKTKNYDYEVNLWGPSCFIITHTPKKQEK